MLGPVAIVHLSGIVGVGGALQEFFHQVNSIIQVVGIHITTVDMDFTGQVGAQFVPVALQYVAQVIIFLPVFGHFMVDFAGFLIPDTLWVAILSLW